MRRIFTAAGCAMAFAMGVTFARADAGSISFSGAVVEPTCAVVASDGAPAPQGTGGARPDLRSCGRTAGDAGQTYARNVVQLDAASVARDRLLDYYAGYAGTGPTGQPDVRLVVRTYQ